MRTFCMTRLEMVEGITRNAVVAMPDDVTQGALFALRISYQHSFCRALRVVRLGAMERHQLQTVFKRLHRCSKWLEIGFVDAEGGVKLPNELKRRISRLSITSPRWYTIRALREAFYGPKILQMCCVDDDAVFELANAWETLTRIAGIIDVTWTCGLTPGHKYDGMFHLPVSSAQLTSMEIDSRRRTVPLGPQYASSFRSRNYWDPINVVGWKAVRMKHWLRGRRCRSSYLIQKFELELDMLEEEGMLTVVVESLTQAKELLLDDGALMKEFAQEVVVGGDRPIDRLQVLVPSVCDSERLTAITAAWLAVEVAAASDVRELVVSSLVFNELADVPLPATVRSVGVVDHFTTSTFLHALPASLERMATDAAASKVRRSVWMQSMRLCDGGDAIGMEVLLKRGDTACRRAETKGLCATGVRGVIEQWLLKRTHEDV
ncbi:hypothetical protein FGB62_218g010 [Gracilaria domingensis]|nr:hypothetical protein FGB62_218g010 [Gracilaria domingensis]